MTARFKRRAGALLTCLALAGTAQAGRPCEAQLPEAASVQRAMGLAERTAQALEATGATVVVLARNGQDLSKYRLRWSHLGLAYREEGAVTDGVPGPAVWRVVHKLNDCGSARGDLYRHGLGEFFMDDLFEYKAGIAVLRPELQARLLPLLRDNQRLATWHTPRYNMLAYPWAQTYQQSNQWAIETLAMAEEPGADTRERAQAWLAFKGYAPTPLHLSAMTRLGARMTAANVAFDDHPNDKRFSDRIETVTVDSVFAWLQRSRLAGRVQEVR
jgi:hypothetical protein